MYLTLKILSCWIIKIVIVYFAYCFVKFTFRGNDQLIFPKLNCRIIGLRSVKGMDGIDFMLNKKEARVKYLETGDALEALWLDLEARSAKVSKIL